MNEHPLSLKSAFSSRCSPLFRTCVFEKSMDSERVLKEFNRGYCFFFDHIPKNRTYLQENPDFILSMSSKNAYNMTITDILLAYLMKKTSFHPFQCDHIVTAAHEAFQNGLLWSNLELKSSVHKPRDLDFDDHIQKRLHDSTYKSRLICLHIYALKSLLEICITVEGKPIEWPQKMDTSTYLRGTQIIKTLCDNVSIDSDKKTIRLHFLYE